MSKMMTTIKLTAGLLLTTACGVSPNGPSALPSTGVRESTSTSTSASMAQTSRKILPPTSCPLSEELNLQNGSRGRGFVEVTSNYRPTDRGCPALVWEFDPADAAKELTPESFAGQNGEGLRIFTGNTTLRGVWVIATSPDGQLAKLHVAFTASLSPRG